MEELIKDKPFYKGLYIVKEYGNKENMHYTPEEVKAYLEHKKKRFSEGFIVAGKTNEQATKGFVTVYDSRTHMLSDKQVYKNSKGFYIQKGGTRFKLDDFKVKG